MARYELLERIGVGGMAEVFRGTAVAAGGFEKPVAIKRILPHLSQDKRFVEMLIREAQILSLLRHRTLVQIYDVGLGPDGNYFLVMEYVDGTDLGAVYESLEEERKRLPVDLALHIAAEVCEGLDCAHAAQGREGEPLHIVHRDVSPANVLLSRSGEVKLTDFGIAKRAEEVTGHGGVRGKYGYISPEQADNRKVDARSDIYSVGIVLFELLLGHRLFSGMVDFEALRTVRDGRIPRPREIDPEIAPELEQILLTALAPDPADRFPTARELGSRLRGYRYALSSSAGDPAQEISRIVQRFAPAEEIMAEREPTVVRIQTADGFASAGGDLDDDADFLEDPFEEARRAFDDYDEEELSASAIDPQAPPELGDVGGARLFGDAVDEVETQVVDAGAPLPGRLDGGAPDDRAHDTERISMGAFERDATPTEKDLFFARIPGPPGTESEVWQSSADRRAARGAYLRSLLLMSLAAVAMAVVSFFITAGIVGADDGNEAASGEAVRVLDAGSGRDAQVGRQKESRKKVEHNRPSGKRGSGQVQSSRTTE